MESHYSQHRLQRGGTVDSGESFLQILKDSPCPGRDIEAKFKLAYGALLKRKILKMSKIVVAIGSDFSIFQI
jgi:hypothetical protein